MPMQVSMFSASTYIQWYRLHGDGGARAPTFTNGWAQGGTMSRTANKKLTKLY